MRWSAIVASVVLLMLGIGGVVVLEFYNSLFSNYTGEGNPENDKAYKAYGEVPIPGTQALHLPARRVAITFHAETVGVPDAGLPIPGLKLNIVPPTGVADPKVTESVGGTTSVDNDSRRQVWVALIPQDGNYQITTDGQAGAFISARLAFGHAEVSSFRIPRWVRPGAGVFAALMFLASAALYKRAQNMEGPIRRLRSRHRNPCSRWSLRGSRTRRPPRRWAWTWPQTRGATGART